MKSQGFFLLSLFNFQGANPAVSRLGACLLSRQLCHYIKPFPFCQHFFSIFFPSFLSFLQLPRAFCANLTHTILFLYVTAISNYPIYRFLSKNGSNYAPVKALETPKKFCQVFLPYIHPATLRTPVLYQLRHHLSAYRAFFLSFQGSPMTRILQSH